MIVTIYEFFGIWQHTYDMGQTDPLDLEPDECNLKQLI